MNKKKSKIKANTPAKGKHISSQETVNYDKRPPIFSLERIQNGNFCFSSLDQEHKAMFSEAIFRRKSITWSDIKFTDRHGLGTEKIPKSSIKAPIPPFITEDVEDFLVFRYHGKNPMVGYRQKDIFYVLWFDHNFTLYKH